jgi:predicted enzyme related to lactoylglutathione lyase
MAIEHVMAGIPTADYATARAFYERLFGRPPDVIPHDAECMWQLNERGWVYVVADAERAGHALVTVMVDDIDAHAPGDAEIEGRPGLYRKATVTDPDGNRFAFGQDLS